MTLQSSRLATITARFTGQWWSQRRTVDDEPTVDVLSAVRFETIPGDADWLE